jgi:hypothetical protein
MEEYKVSQHAEIVTITLSKDSFDQLNDTLRLECANGTACSIDVLGLLYPLRLR